MEKHFINLGQSELKALISKKFNETDIKIYLYICSKMTFAHGLFGIFSNHTIYSIQKDLEYDDKNTVKRAIEKLEKNKLLFVVSRKKGLILSKSDVTTAQVQSLIESNYEDFNLNNDRLTELEQILSIQFNRGKIYAKINEEKRIRDKIKNFDSSKITRPTESIIDTDSELSENYELIFGSPVAPGRAN